MVHQKVTEGAGPNGEGVVLLESRHRAGLFWTPGVFFTTDQLLSEAVSTPLIVVVRRGLQAPTVHAAATCRPNLSCSSLLPPPPGPFIPQSFQQ